MYDETLRKNNLQDNDIKEIFASGMVTSPYGIKEVPHLNIPMDLKGLSRNIYTHFEDLFFHREINLIRGLKDIPDNDDVSKNNIFEVNSMRGEETEIFGVLKYIDKVAIARPMAIIMPGSHTQIVYIIQDKVVDFVSTISGELFYAISHDTIVSSSIDATIKTYDNDMVKKAFNILIKYGFNKSVYLINTMRIFNVADIYEKTSFLEGVILGGDVLCFEKYLNEKWQDVNNVVIYADEGIAKVYETLLKMLDKKMDIYIVNKSEVNCAVKGFLEILRARNENWE
jgi:2-keto-3-deoxy-galactonokinase